MRIISGLDTDFSGEAWAASGAKIGYLPQEPELNVEKTVRENIFEGVAEKRALLEKFNSIALEIGENYTDELMKEMTVLQDKIDADDLWDLDSRIDIAIKNI